MSKRRKARETALKALYQIDLVQAEPGEALRHAVLEELLRPLVEPLVRDQALRHLRPAPEAPVEGSEGEAPATGPDLADLERFAAACAEVVAMTWPAAMVAAEVLQPALREQLPALDSEGPAARAALADVSAALAGKLPGLAGIASFASALVHETVAHGAELDALLARFADNWSLERMAALDRCILRMGACELLHFPDIPSSVSINEAVDLAKKFSTAKSSEFVNGVLDRIRRDVKPVKVDGRARPAPATPTPPAGDGGGGGD